jgi:homoserine O-acetyltransferase
MKMSYPGDRTIGLILLFGVIWPSVGAIAEGDHKIFNLGDFAVESGVTLPNAKLSYVTHGRLTVDKSNAVLMPSFAGGDHHGYDFLIGPGKAFDPEKFFIIATDMFTNGLSSSPSNTPVPFNGPKFPAIAIRDNVRAVYRLLTEEFGIQRLHSVAGFSMGAQQAFQWAVSYPDYMSNVVAWCGTAKEYPHGVVRLEGFKSAVMADAAFDNGNYTETPEVGLKAGARHWAGWGMSQEWYRQELYKQMGHETLEGFLQDFWEAAFLGFDANDLLSQMTMWQNNNVGDTLGYGGDHESALRSIRARVLYLACETDMYFPLEALQYEAEFIPDVTFIVIPSLWGHLAGDGIFSEEDGNFLNEKIGSFVD